MRISDWSSACALPISIAAIVRWTFPEVTQQYGAATTARLHQSAKRGNAGALARLPRFVQFEDALASLREIFRAPEKMRFGRLAIATGTSTLLVIGITGSGDRKRLSSGKGVRAR